MRACIERVCVSSGDTLRPDLAMRRQRGIEDDRNMSNMDLRSHVFDSSDIIKRCGEKELSVCVAHWVLRVFACPLSS